MGVLKWGMAVLVVLAGFAFWHIVTGQRPNIIALSAGPFRAAWLVPNDGSKTVSVEIIFQSGEADATGPEGIAHYIEHLSWMNANKDAPGDVQRHANAWTIGLATGYTAQSDTNDLNVDLKRLTAVVADLTVDPTFALEERDIVLREYDLNFRENAFVPIYNEINKVLFDRASLSRSERWSRIFGPVVKVDRMTKEVIQNDETKEPFARFQSQGCA